MIKKDYLWTCILLKTLCSTLNCGATPHDYVTQKGVFDMQIEAKEYMDSLPPSKLKTKMERDYPNDYVTQKGVYDMQIEARERMK